MEKSKLMKEIKEKINELLQQISKENSIKIKHNLYKEILKLDNTNKSIIFDYLILLKEMTEKKEIKNDELKKELQLYIHVIPKDEYNKAFSEYIIKKNSSFEEIKLFLEKIKNINNNYTTIKQKAQECSFITDKIEEHKSKINNNCPITYDNIELYTYSLFHLYLSTLMEKIKDYLNINFDYSKNEDYLTADKLIKDIEKFISNLKDETIKKECVKIFKKAQDNKELIIKNIILFEGDFYMVYL